MDLPSPLFLIFYLVAAVIQVQNSNLFEIEIQNQKTNKQLLAGGDPALLVPDPGLLDVEEGSRP